MSPVYSVSVIYFLVSLALDTAYDSVGFFFLNFVAVFFFKIFSNSWSNWCVGREFSSTIPPCIHSWERSLSILLPTPIAHALVVVSFFLPFFIAYIEAHLQLCMLCSRHIIQQTLS